MPLPVRNTPWPPPALDRLMPAFRAWSAWYAGDGDALSAAYGGSVGTDPTGTGFFASQEGGFKAAVASRIVRWFWGSVTLGPERRTKLHVPIAADICQASADLIFADGFKLTATNTGAQDHLDELIDDGMQTALAEAAEVAGALGGTYLRVTWDDQVADAPFTTRVDADQAVPEFMWDQLRAVTFWSVVNREGKQVWRHLERHELDDNGIGIIQHGLYQGDEGELGHAVPLTDSSVTAPLAMIVDENGTISTESPGLAVTYFPNQKPQRRWRLDPVGKSLGRADLDGVEGLMDALDEVYSSWMRDIRLGKARIMVNQSLLESQGKGQGQVFDHDREVYSPVNALTKGDQKLAEQMSAQQFAIRVNEHSATADKLVAQILRTAGYSSQTFGEGQQGSSHGQQTATEVESRERRSLLTRDRKLRLARPALVRHVTKLLAVEARMFKGKGTDPGKLVATFPDGVQESQLTLAQTAQALRVAEAASTKTLVQLVHPDWDDVAVSAEVALIESEKPEPLTDPGAFGRGTDDPTGAAVQ